MKRRRRRIRKPDPDAMVVAFRELSFPATKLISTQRPSPRGGYDVDARIEVRYPADTVVGVIEWRDDVPVLTTAEPLYRGTIERVVRRFAC